MQRCLNKEQSVQLLDIDVENFKLRNDPSEFEILLHNCRNWDAQLTLLAYLMSQIFESKSKQGIDKNSLTDKLYKMLDLREYIWLNIQEFDVNFIDYLYRYTKDDSLNLEESLVQIQDWLNEHKYS